MKTFDYDYNINDKYILFNLQGELDAYYSENTKDNILKDIENKNKDIIIFNFKEVKYVDSAGLGCLISILKELKNNDKKLLLCDLNENIKRVFYLTRLDNIFDIFENKEVILNEYNINE